MEYVESSKQPDDKSLFTNILESGNDRAALILYRSQHAFLILNKFPYNAGHLMAVPLKEVPTLADLNLEERADYMDIIIKGQEILTKALSPSGFNIGMNIGSAAGAGIPGHLHCHIVPRWQGDTNFMPVVGNTRVLPQALDTMWQRLKQFATEEA